VPIFVQIGCIPVTLEAKMQPCLEDVYLHQYWLSDGIMSNENRFGSGQSSAPLVSPFRWLLVVFQLPTLFLLCWSRNSLEASIGPLSRRRAAAATPPPAPTTTAALTMSKELVR
jgi:hypothetical protein